MKIDKRTYAVLSLVFGVLVIFNPGILAWLVGIYLILTGAMGLFK